MRLRTVIMIRTATISELKTTSGVETPINSGPLLICHSDAGISEDVDISTRQAYWDPAVHACFQWFRKSGMRLPRTVGGGNRPYIYCTLTFDIWRLPLPPGLACWALNPPIMLGTRSSDYHADVHEAVQRPHKLNCAAGDTTTEFSELCANMEFVKHVP